MEVEQAKEQSIDSYSSADAGPKESVGENKIAVKLNYK